MCEFKTTRISFSSKIQSQSEPHSPSNSVVSQEEEVKSHLSVEDEMCQEDYDFFEWQDVCECEGPITMDECNCQEYKLYQEQKKIII
jgi:hypothetical protein